MKQRIALSAWVGIAALLIGVPLFAGTPAASASTLTTAPSVATPAVSLAEALGLAPETVEAVPAFITPCQPIPPHCCRLIVFNGCATCAAICS